MAGSRPVDLKQCPRAPPLLHGGGFAVLAARLIGQVPRHDGGVVLVANPVDRIDPIVGAHLGITL